MKRLALVISAALALTGCASSSSTPGGYVKAPAMSCAKTFAVQHHISIAAAKNVKCKLVWQYVSG